MLADAEESADDTESQGQKERLCYVHFASAGASCAASGTASAGGGGSDEDQVFEDHVRNLKGLRVGMSLSHHGSSGSGGISNWQKCVPNICSEWLTMEVVPDISSTTKADLLLWSYEYKYAQCI
ncbi:hypothetical protein E4U28_006285 [Claviceps purpurea]|nr:hypothetical protein E4U28_006285 [Claviceps purpurea]